MSTNRPLPGALATVLLTLAVPAAGQPTGDGGPDPATVRVRMGPLWMNPSISLPNMGIDTNVFNEPPSAMPAKDFTMTVAPKAAANGKAEFPMTAYD